MTSKELFLAADLLDHAASCLDGSHELDPEIFTSFRPEELSALLERFHRHNQSAPEDFDLYPPDYAWADFLADKLRAFATAQQPILPQLPVKTRLRV